MSERTSPSVRRSLEELQPLASLVNFGALFGFLMLHVAVVVHYSLRCRSRDWLRHLSVPWTRIRDHYVRPDPHGKAREDCRHQLADGRRWGTPALDAPSRWAAGACDQREPVSATLRSRMCPLLGRRLLAQAGQEATATRLIWPPRSGR